jgi:hypothetical protein
MTRSPISASPLRQIDLRFTVRKFTPLDGKAELCPTVFFSRSLSELERTALLDRALQARRWDLVALLIEWGADRGSCSVLNFDAVTPSRRVPRLEGLEQAGALWLSVG